MKTGSATQAQRYDFVLQRALRENKQLELGVDEAQLEQNFREAAGIGTNLPNYWTYFKGALKSGSYAE